MQQYRISQGNQCYWWRREKKWHKSKKTPKTEQKIKPKQHWVKIEIVTIWPYPQHILCFSVNVQVHVRRQELQILLLLLLDQKTAHANSVCKHHWSEMQRHCFIIHTTPSTGYNLKYPAYIVRSVLKYLSNHVMYLKFSSILDWTYCLTHVIH